MGTFTPPRIVACICGKGGVGKTTCIMCIAGCLAASGAKVIVVDIDFPQKSALYWSKKGKLNFEVVQVDDPAYLLKLKQAKGVQYVLVDSPGNLDHAPLLKAVAEQSDLIIAPTEADPLSSGPFRDTIRNVIAPSGTPFAALISRFDTRRVGDDITARNDLVKAKIPVFPTVMRDRASHSRAPGFGITAPHYKADSSGALQAISDAESLTSQVRTAVDFGIPKSWLEPAKVAA